MPARMLAETLNPKNLPLSELFLHIDVDGVSVQVPALDRRWVEARNFSTYTGLVVSGGKLKSGADLEEWTNVAERFCDDMEFLLNCKHHEFWSHMVHEKSALAAIVSFLQRANPFYLDISQQQEYAAVAELYQQILNNVVRVLCRMVTNKESEAAWIKKQHLSELVYSNFLISIPMLLDLIIALGDVDSQNLAFLTKFFQTLFNLEAKYRDDLLAALAYFPTAFRTIQTQSENEGFEGAGGGVIDEDFETPYDDVVFYTLDCAYTLSILFEVCPDVHSLCYKIHLAQSIAQFYDCTIPFLYKNIWNINEVAKSLCWLNMARIQFLKAFRSIANSYLMCVLNKPNESLTPSENFIGLLTECLSERIFVIDYQREYPVELDMDILKQACVNLDNFKADFVVQGYQQEADSYAINIVNNMAEIPDEKPKPRKTATLNNNAVNASKKKPTAEEERNLEDEVAAALEMLPHLGTGFLRRVLSRYKNSEEALAAILEENLPPDLLNADQKEVYIPADPQDILYQQTGLQHFNVHDGDAFDIMTRDNPNCIIKQGKGFPNAPKNALELLDDKREVQQMKHRYQEYSLVSDDEHGNGEYDDEYDDSYEALLESETRAIKSKELKASLAEIDDVSEDDSEENDDDERNVENEISDRRGEKSLNFCENPEIIRARYEANRLAKRGSGRKGGVAQQQHNSKTFDVVGAPKGQGQDKETLKNRNKKEVHKSSRANHNRKAGAAFKRSKGMMS